MALKHFKLNTGDSIPSVGLGTWQGLVQAELDGTVEVVKNAIKAGYRHIDAASAYGNHKQIGAALRECFDAGIVRREDLWITSKLWATEQDHVAEALDEALSDLQLDYLDLYLVHWPVRMRRDAERFDIRPETFATVQLKETWADMEKLLLAKKVRAIGVSNFSSKKLDELLSHAKVVPAVNQVECHPAMHQKKLHEYCAAKGIHLSGYSPLGNWQTTVLSNPVVQDVASKLGKSPAQVALRWGLQSGHSVLPKSSNVDRMKQNLDIYDWEIPKEEFQRFSAIQQVRLVDGQVWINNTTSPYKTVQELWDEDA